VADRLQAYLDPAAARSPAAGRPRRAGGAAAVSRLAAAAGGAGLGALIAAGHLFVAALPAQAPALVGLGAAAGLLGHRIRRKRAAAERAARLLRELPTVADTLALSILAGESVGGAVERFAAGARGVAAEELQAALARHRSGTGLIEALTEAAAATAHPEAARLYDLLGHAHRTGGRLADALADLAIDYRATLARDLTAEGGRRALAAYGPILALMIPVTLVFLMYPTLAGLVALSEAAP
jgi:tight adherence protein C